MLLLCLILMSSKFLITSEFVLPLEKPENSEGTTLEKIESQEEEEAEEIKNPNYVNISDKVVCSNKWNTFERGPYDYHQNFLNYTFFSPVVNEYFTFSPDTNAYIVKNMETPIFFNGVFYFWDGYKKEVPINKNMSVLMQHLSYSQCTYTITDQDRQLFNVTTPNGTKPEALEFQCNSKYCCGLTCCQMRGYHQKYMKVTGISKGSGPLWVIGTMFLVGVFVAVAVVVFALYRIKHDRHFSTTPTTARIVIHSPSTVTPRSISPISRGLCPRPPCINSQFHQIDVGPLSSSHVIATM